MSAPTRRRFNDGPGLAQRTRPRGVTTDTNSSKKPDGESAWRVH